MPIVLLCITYFMIIKRTVEIEGEIDLEGDPKTHAPILRPPRLLLLLVLPTFPSLVSK